jgi:tetratricopeptide (TPR) repeat protein
MKMKVLKTTGFILVLSFLIAGFAFSQAGRGKGRILGVILDLEGKPIDGAKVSIVFSEVGGLTLDTKTNKKGEWSFLGLGSGNWDLKATADGYLPESKNIYVAQLELNPKITIHLKKSLKTTSSFIQDEASLLLLDEGGRFFKEEKFDMAIVIYEEFLKKNPLAYQIFISIGDCYREKGDFQKATENYNFGLEASKKDIAGGTVFAAKALAGIGNCFVKQGQLQEAQDFFKKSIETSPKDELLAYNVGEIYFSNQNPDEALKYLDLASQIKPEWPDPYLKMGYVYLNKGDNPNAVAKFEKFLSLEPGSERSAPVKSILGLIKK